jgi:hypothetical protein
VQHIKKLGPPKFSLLFRFSPQTAHHPDPWSSALYLLIVYLDLSVSVHNSQFHVKVYCKTSNCNFSVVTLPFLDSNVAVEMCYYVYFGQILVFF